MYQINDSIEMLEALLLEHSRIHVIFQVPIIERYPNAVEFQTGEELGIGFREEVLEPFVEEELIFLLPEDLQH